MSSKSKYKPQAFESRGKYQGPDGKLRADTSANLYESMLLSPAWQSLTDKQKVLYLTCKAQYYGKRKPGQEKEYAELKLYQGDDYFFLNWGNVQQYGLYTEKSHPNFYKDMKALADHGFIERVSSGAARHTKSVYRYSHKWQEWEP